MEKLFNLKCYPPKNKEGGKGGWEKRFNMNYELCKGFITVRSFKILNLEKSCLLGLCLTPQYIIDFRNFSWLSC